MKLWKEMFPNETSLSPEEYEKHMDSHRRIEKDRLDAVMKQLEGFLKKL